MAYKKTLKIIGQKFLGAIFFGKRCNSLRSHFCKTPNFKQGNRDQPINPLQADTIQNKES